MFGIEWLDPETLISSFGGFALFGVCLIVFIETGLLVGFFLPGDSLLFVAGLLISTGVIDAPIWLACLLISLSAFAGDQTGYWIGRKAGPAVFNREESKLFKPANVEHTHRFFEKYGSKAIILAHFVPVMRTFVPVAAGVGKMSYKRFVRLNVIGVVLWGTGVTLLGYFLGQIEFVEKNIEYFTIGFIIVSTIPIAMEILRSRKQERSKLAKS
jgi:membrane-associated protein